MLTTHGDDTYRYKGIKLNFSSNISTATDLQGLKAHIMANIDKIASYPEPEAYTLERIIAEREGVDKRCVVVTNGATEAIYLLAQIFSGSKSTIAQPTFSEYETACNIYNHEICKHGNIVWICNPNNPTGTVIREDSLKSTLLYIIDHAYEDYTTEPLLSDKDAVAMGNVIIIHSMTKQYGIPGLRLGYITANVDIAERVRSVKQPWSVNALALTAGEYLSQHGQHPDTRTLLAEAKRLNEQLNTIDGIKALPTKTNFMLCSIDKGSAAKLKEYLAKRHGMLIRDASSFKGLTPHHFRIAAQRLDDDMRLVEAIKEYMLYG